MEKTLMEAAQILQRISKGAAMQRDWENRLSGGEQEVSQVGTLAGIFRKRAPEAKKEEPKLEKIAEESHNKEGPIKDAESSKIEDAENNKPKGGERSLANAQPLKELDRTDWIPIDFEEIFDKRRPYPNQEESIRGIEPGFPPEKHSGYELNEEAAGEIIQRLFDDDERIDPKFIAEAKRIIGVKSEASSYALIVKICAINPDEEGEDNLSTPHIECEINGEKFDKALCDTGAHVSVMSSKVYSKLYMNTLKLAPTSIKLTMGDGRTIKPLGMLKDLGVVIARKLIPTDFYVIDANNDDHDDIILGRPFLKLVNAVLDAGKGRVTIELDGNKFDYDFLSDPRAALPLPLDNEGVESIRFVETFRDPLQRALENDTTHDEQDEDLNKATEGLEARDGIIEEEGFEEIGDLHQEEPEAPDVELKSLPKGLKYEFLGNNKTYPVIVSDELSPEEAKSLLKLLKKHKKVIGYTIKDLKGISPAFCTHRIQLEDDHKPVVEHQRRLSYAMRDVVKKEVIKLLNAGIIYPVPHSEWVSPVHCVPKKGGLTVVQNEKNELIPQRTITGWRMCIDYRKLNKATRKDHFPLPFIDEMLERLAKHSHFCYLDGYSGFFQIPIHPDDQHKTTFTCPYGTFAYRRMPFGLCNAPASFQRCMMAIFSDFIEEIMEVFMDDFSVHGTSFDDCLKNLEKVLTRCGEVDLVLNWEKCHFMVKQGIVLGHVISERGIEVDKAKIETVEKLPPPTDIKSLRSFLGHARFYRRFIKDFSKITKPLTQLLQKDVEFNFDESCLHAF